MKQLKDQLEEKLPWLFSELGFRIASYSYDPASFGNSVAVLDSDAFRLRLTRDRGITVADVASLSDREEWLGFPYVWEMIFGETPEPTLEGYGPLIRQGFGAFTEALGPKYSQTKELYDQRAKERLKRLEKYSARRGKMFGPTPRFAIGQILTNPFGWALGWALLTPILWLFLSAKRPS
jgi:hypothetical protein